MSRKHDRNDLSRQRIARFPAPLAYASHCALRSELSELRRRAQPPSLRTFGTFAARPPMQRGTVNLVNFPSRTKSYSPQGLADLCHLEKINRHRRYMHGCRAGWTGELA